MYFENKYFIYLKRYEAVFIGKPVNGMRLRADEGSANFKD